MMRRRYLVCYDICDEKRLRQVFKIMQGFGERLQYSVYLCDLSAEERILLRAKLHEVIRHEEDRVMMVDLGEVGTARAHAFEFMGAATPVEERRVVVI